MKGKVGGIVQLLLSILVIFLFHNLYFNILGVFGFHFTGISYEIVNFIKYLLVCIIVFVIYHGNVKKGQNKFNKALLTSILFSAACFIFLVTITILINKLVNYFGNPNGINIGYGFTNYFDNSFNLSFALNFIREAIFIPFLLCIIFPLGFSNIIKKDGTATLICGIVYGILYGISLKTNLQTAIFHSITPAILMATLTYLYKMNNNIWTVYITYVCYVLFGIFAINYI